MGRRGASIVAAALALGAAAPAFADGAEDRVRSASEEFDRGRRLFAAKRYDEAALHFENAFRDAPRSAPLRSAARAFLSAGRADRAATLTALAEERYGEEDGTKELAREVYPKANGKLATVVLSCEPACTVTLDGALVGFGEERVTTIWLTPGEHRLGARWSGDRFVERPLTVKAGEKRPVQELAPAAVAPPVAPPPVVAPPVKPPSPPPEARKPLPPGVFWGGVAVTGALGVAATISGVSTIASPGKDRVREECVGLGTSCPLYQDARAKQARTNVLFAVTGGAAVITGALYFFVDWKGPKVDAAVHAGGGAIAVRGTF